MFDFKKRVFDISNGDGSVTNKIVINITGVIRPTILPDLYVNRTQRVKMPFPKVDFATEANKFKLTDHTYIGTVGSIVTDKLCDVYAITEGDDLYFIVFPSLLFLGDSDSFDGVVTYNELPAMAFGLTNTKGTHTSGYTAIDSKNTNDFIATLSSTLTVATPSKLHMTTLSLYGATESAFFGMATVYVEGGELGANGLEASQWLLLGDISDLITDIPADGLSMQTATLHPESFMKVDMVRTNRAIKKGMLAIPLNM